MSEPNEPLPIPEEEPKPGSIPPWAPIPVPFPPQDPPPQPAVEAPDLLAQVIAGCTDAKHFLDDEGVDAQGYSKIYKSEPLKGINFALAAALKMQAGSQTR